MVAATAVYVTSTFGDGSCVRLCRRGHIGYTSFAATIAGGGLPVVRYEDALSRDHQMRRYMLCQYHDNQLDAVSDGVPISPRLHLILNAQYLAKWGKGDPQCVV